MQTVRIQIARPVAFYVKFWFCCRLSDSVSASTGEKLRRRSVRFLRPVQLEEEYEKRCNHSHHLQTKVNSVKNPQYQCLKPIRVHTCNIVACPRPKKPFACKPTFQSRYHWYRMSQADSPSKFHLISITSRTSDCLWLTFFQNKVYTNLLKLERFKDLRHFLKTRQRKPIAK